MDEPDRNIVLAAQRGDERAFIDLVRHCQTDVYRLLAHQVGDPELSADLTQETFLRAHSKLDTFRGDASFSGWLLRIARNQEIDAQRRQRRLTHQLTEHFARSRGTTHAPTSATFAETKTELAAALQTLSPDYRDAFVLVEILGYKYREVATVLQTNENAVKGRVFRARQQLIAWFEAGT